MNNTYKFNKSLCDVLNISDNDQYTIDYIVDKIVNDMYKNKSKLKILDKNIAKYFGKNTNQYIWLNELKNLIRNNIINHDNNYINKYVVIGYDNCNIKNIVVDLY
jgi:hypothetical protein